MQGSSYLSGWLVLAAPGGELPHSHSQAGGPGGHRDLRRATGHPVATIIRRTRRRPSDSIDFALSVMPQCAVCHACGLLVARLLVVYSVRRSTRLPAQPPGHRRVNTGEGAVFPLGSHWLPGHRRDQVMMIPLASNAVSRSVSATSLPRIAGISEIRRLELVRTSRDRHGFAAQRIGTSRRAARRPGTQRYDPRFRKAAIQQHGWELVGFRRHVRSGREPLH